MVHRDLRRDPSFDVFADGYRRCLLLCPMGAKSGMRNVEHGRNHRPSDDEPLFRLNGVVSHFRRRNVQLDVFERSGHDGILFRSKKIQRNVGRELVNAFGSFPRRHLQCRRLNLADRDPHRIFLQRMVHGDFGRNPNNFSHRDYRCRDLLRAMDATDVCGLRLVLNERERGYRFRMLNERHGGFGMSVLANGNSVRNGLQQRDGDPYELHLFDDDERSREPYGERYERGGKLFGEFADLHLCGEAHDWYGMEYRLVVPPDMERLGMVSRWDYDGIQRYGQYDRMPIQVRERIFVERDRMRRSKCELRFAMVMIARAWSKRNRIPVFQRGILVNLHVANANLFERNAIWNVRIRFLFLYDEFRNHPMRHDALDARIVLRRAMQRHRHQC